MQLIECQFCHEVKMLRSGSTYCSNKCRWDAANERKAMARKQADPLDFENGLPSSGTGGRFARNKGARVEREVCQVIERTTGDAVSRILGQARDGGLDVKWGPFGIEVKARETVAMPAWQKQVSAAVEGSDMIPAVVWRRKGEKFWVALPFEEFLSVFDQLRRAAEAGLNDRPPDTPT